MTPFNKQQENYGFKGYFLLKRSTEELNSIFSFEAFLFYLLTNKQ